MKTMVKIFALLLVAAHFGFSYRTAGPAPAVSGGDEISSRTYDLVREKLVDPYAKKVKYEGKRKAFSRCPSGYSPQISKLAGTEHQYSYGVMNLWKGCDDSEVCRFRTRLSDKTVEVLQSDSINYLPAHLWMENATSRIDK